ncbi:MAG: molybdopterin molybdotransferase MoeA [Anaerorhabdus sp.]
MLNVISVKDALELIKNKSELESIQVKLNDSLGYYLSEDIIAKENVPDFNRSLVDGYCVKSKDVFGASLSIPAILKYQGSINMGESFNEPLKDGCCIYIPTGAKLAEGSDSIVMIEYVEDISDGFRYISKPSAPGDHITYRADDIKQNEVIICKGTKITSKIIGVLSALGYDLVNVFKKLKVGIIATGDELVETSSKLTEAKIRDINNPLLASLISEANCDVNIYGIVKDNEDKIKEAISSLKDNCDIVLISGGSSVGEKDKTLEILNSFKNSKTYFHGLALKPGKPTMFTRIDNCDIFGLPGHPLACYFVFQTLIYPYILDRYKTKSAKVKVAAYSKVSIGSNHGREELLIVKTEKIGDKYYFSPLPSKSGMISKLAKGDAYLRIPRDKEGINENELVEITLI